MAQSRQRSSIFGRKIESEEKWNWTEVLKTQPLDPDHVRMLEEYPDLRKVAVSLQRSEVGFLIGDGLRLWEVAAQRDVVAAAKQKQVDEAAKKAQERAQWAKVAALDDHLPVAPRMQA